MRRATRWSVLLTIALGAVIAILTLMPPTEVDIPAGSDKSYHALAFAALALPLATVRPRWSAVWFVLFTAYGAAIEIIQPYVGRSREFADLLADMSGIGCALVVGFLLNRLHHTKPRTSEDS
ncbi:VanZ family protein [Tessaracoccus sp.]